MSRPRATTGSDVHPGRFRLGSRLLDRPGLIEFDAAEIASPGRKVTIAMLQGFTFEDDVRGKLLQSLRLIQAMNFRNFPRILEIDRTSAAPETDIWVISNWKAGSSIAQVLDNAKKKDLKPDAPFALYILKTLCSAVSILHQCRVSEFKTIHGALTPESIWLDAEGNVRCHNHFFGLAAAFEQSTSLEESYDVRSMGELYWNLITTERWLNVSEATRLNPNEDTIRILEATGLWNGSGCSSVHELAEVVDRTIVGGTYYATQGYASYWQREACKRLPKAVVTPKAPVVRSIAPRLAPALISPNASIPVSSRPQTGKTPRVRPAGIPQNSLVPWIVLIVVLLLAGGAGVWFLVSRQQAQRQVSPIPEAVLTSGSNSVSEVRQ